MPVAIILGHLAKSEIRRTGDPGGGLATAGLTLGYMGLALFFVALFGGSLIGPGHAYLVVGLFFAIPGCLIATLITVIYRQRRQAGS